MFAVVMVIGVVSIASGSSSGHLRAWGARGYDNEADRRVAATVRAVGVRSLELASQPLGSEYEAEPNRQRDQPPHPP
jgi:hypothetical protein